MIKSNLNVGDRFYIDTYRVSQYEDMRVVDVVEIVEIPKKYAKKVLCYSKKLLANILVFRTDLKSTSLKEIK